jgi:DNA (cytosine-5)-methyltransferase 1
MNKKEPKFIVIDLFCGAGGTTTGFDNVEECAVIACVNHDENAIKSHAANHPDAEHFTEDITLMYGSVWKGIHFKSPELLHMMRMVDLYRAFYPEVKVVLWASLECTNFSKAKGGQARDGDSRTLANHMDRYYVPLEPEYIMIENVVEFMAWGPLDENGKPISRKNGVDFMRWCNHVCSFGYANEWKELNSADFGAYTSRNRLFGIFGKDDSPIVWPEATHEKRGKGRVKSIQEGMFKEYSPKLPWKAVKEVLDFSDEGKSIFERKKALSDKTLERIYAGLIKFVAGGKEAFLVKYNSMGRDGRYCPPNMEEPMSVVPTRNMHYIAFISKYYSGKPEGKNIGVDGPAGTVTTIDGQAVVQAFMVQRNTGNPDSKLVDIEGPARTVTSTGGNQDVVSAFLANYYSSGGELTSILGPAPCITTKDRISKIHPCFIMRDFTGGGQVASIEQPAGTVMPYPKLNLVTPFVMPTNYDNKPSSIDDPLSTITANRKHHYIVNPSHGGHTTGTDVPGPVVVARQDKAPLSMVVVDEVDNKAVGIAVRVDEADSDIMIKIKEFMVLYDIVDIKMRMLKIVELLKIQGFPDDYKLVGTQSDQKKFIGNAVHPLVPEHMANALIRKLNEQMTAAA